MKLSEVLSKAVDALEKSPWTSDGEPCEALRAIAPALVAFALVAYEPHTCLRNPSKESCPICGLYNAMKEAGVTCE